MHPHSTRAGEDPPDDWGEGVTEVCVHMSARSNSLVLARFEERSLSEGVGRGTGTEDGENVYESRPPLQELSLVRFSPGG